MTEETEQDPTVELPGEEAPAIESPGDEPVAEMEMESMAAFSYPARRP